jgi:hypothetical protein
MIDISTILSSTSLSLNLSFLGLILAGFILLLGKNIADVRPAYYTKTGYQRAGVFFFSKNILIPALVAYLLITYLGSLPLFLAYFLIVIVLGLYSLSIFTEGVLNRGNQLENFTEGIESKSKELKEDSKRKQQVEKVGEKVNTDIDFDKKVDFWVDQFEFIMTELGEKPGKNHYVFLSSTVLVYSSISLILTSNPIHLGFSIFALILGYSSISYGYAYSDVSYPSVEIVTDQNNHSGKLLKKGKLYVELQTEEGQITVPREKVDTIKPS